VRGARLVARPLLLAATALLAQRALAAGQALLHMEIGDPARRAREVPLLLDGITDTATGELITPETLARRLAGTGILFIGENHTDQNFHDVQLRTIRALQEAGRPVLIGLEMFPYGAQAALDQWLAAPAAGLAEPAGWYEHWGYHWNYYREIFHYARERGLTLHAINSPRETVKAVRARGFGELTPEQAARYPPRLAEDSDEHRRMYRAFFDPDDALHMSPAALDGLYRAQVAWDATMGWNALQALREHGAPGAIMVVLIGTGHVSYGLGAERQIAPHYAGRIASLIPVPVADDEGRPVTTVRASFAAFTWGVPEETEPLYPGLGISLMGALGEEPTRIIQVSARSVGERAGLKVGDVLLAIDGAPLASDQALRRELSRYRWGDVATVRLKRDGREQDVVVPLRRLPRAEER
jgi:uncharacterized iron-regulated protein